MRHQGFMSVVLVALVACPIDGYGKKRIIAVPATALWTDTGIDVVRGAMIRLEASGQIHDGDSFYGPEGRGGTHIATSDHELPGVPRKGLIGRIGSSGRPFFVGSRYSERASASGRLYLGINEHYAPGYRSRPCRPGGWCIATENNRGQWVVKLLP